MGKELELRSTKRYTLNSQYNLVFENAQRELYSVSKRSPCREPSIEPERERLEFHTASLSQLDILYSWRGE